MNKIIVARYKDETQGLFNIDQIMRIGEEQAACYKQQWRKEKAKLQALVDWCWLNGVERLDVYRMDGTRDGWLIECTGRR